MSSTTAEAIQIEAKTKPTGKVRKRAPKACLSCRARKVRCDVSQRGRPCMNCYLDSETCVVTGRASRLSTQRTEDNVQASYPPYEVDDRNPARTAEDVVRSRLNGEPAPPAPNRDESPFQESQHEGCGGHSHEEPPPAASTQDVSRPPVQPAVPNLNAQDLHRHSGPTVNMKNHNPAIIPNVVGSDAPLWAGDQRVGVTDDITYTYYPFLCINNLQNIMPQDVNYLETQGCFRVPTRDILDEFVQQYFLHFHPMLPMINEGDFWDMYGHSGHGGSGDIMSLLVFQAMLFSSCTFVSKTSIKALGFPTIRAARATLYRRCKLLYDFETENSVVHISQASLMLSHWSNNVADAFRKGNSIWLSIAIQNARTAEAHHYSAMPTCSASSNPLEHKKQNVLKRLWWCCVLRDRILPLGLRRSVKITRTHFDFDANPGLGYNDLADEIDRSRVYSSGTKRCLIEICVQAIELCTVLTDLLTLVFPLDESPGWGKGSEDSEKVRECKQALRRWYKGATLRFPLFGGDAVPRVKITGGKEFQHDSVILYTNLMYMYYHSARVALSHYEVLKTAVAAASPNLASNLKEFSNIYENRHELQDAACGMTECLKELIQLKLARWLPISAVACTALPLVLHVIDVKLSSYNQSNSAPVPRPEEAIKQHRLNILIEAMKTYQPQYGGVDYVSKTIRHIVNIAQLDTPAPPTTANVINDWQDVLASQPGCYLRLAMTMDLSLSKGRLPEESDFPASLRGLFTAGYSSIKVLMDAGKTNLAPLPQQNTSFGSMHDHMFLPANISSVVTGTVKSLPSDADTNSPGSMDSHSTTQQQTSHDSTSDMHQSEDPSGDVAMMEYSFVDAALELEGLAGEALTGYFMPDDSPHSSSGSDGDGDGTLFDSSDTAATDWIGNAWGHDEVNMGGMGMGMGMGDKGDNDTARVLLEALKEGGEQRAIEIDCSA